MSEYDPNTKHSYYANALGFAALCVAFIFFFKGCTELMVEREKTTQMKMEIETAKTK